MKMKIQLCTVAVKISNEKYWNTFAHVSFRPQVCFENSFSINNFFLVTVKNVMEFFK